MRIDTLDRLATRSRDTRTCGRSGATRSTTRRRQRPEWRSPPWLARTLASSISSRTAVRTARRSTSRADRRAEGDVSSAEGVLTVAMQFMGFEPMPCRVCAETVEPDLDLLVTLGTKPTATSYAACIYR